MFLTIRACGVVQFGFRDVQDLFKCFFWLPHVLLYAFAAELNYGCPSLLIDDSHAHMNHFLGCVPRWKHAALQASGCIWSFCYEVFTSLSVLS